MKKHFRLFLAVTLAMLLAITSPLQAFAEGTSKALYTIGSPTTYISELRISGSVDWLRENGYTPLKDDLNDETGEGYAYIGYKTTTNPDEAITDISLMDMKGGYYRTDYRKMMEKYDAQMNSLADDMLVAAAEFKANYQKNSPAAEAAYKALNFLYVDEDNNMPFGDWIMSENATKARLFDMILMCDPVIMNVIYNQLAIGVQIYDKNNQDYSKKENNNTTVDLLDLVNPVDTDVEKNKVIELPETYSWLARLSQNGPEKLSDDEYYDDAYSISATVRIFADCYKAASERKAANEGNVVIPDATTDEELDEQLEEVGNRNDTGELTTDSNSDYLVMSVYDQLAMYPYGDGTVADLFTADYSEDIEGLYSLVKAMTPGQVAMLRIAGVNMMVATRINNAEVYKDFDKEFTETSEGITCSVWAGANRDIYQGEIGVTDAAKREMAALGDFEALTNDNDTLRGKLKNVAMGVGIAAASVAAVACLAFMVAEVSMGICAAVGAGVATTLTWMGFAIAATFIAYTAVIGVVILCVALLVIGVIALVDYIKEWYDDTHPTYTSIPDIMYDLVVDEEGNASEYVRYDAVRDSNDGKGDLNTWDAREWIAVYTTKDKVAGSPIVVDSLGNVFTVQYNNGETPNGYAPMHIFGSKTAMDTNSHVYDHGVSIYVFYHTEEAITGSGNKAQTSTGKTLYVREVLIDSRGSADAARFNLENKGFTVINMDLTSWSDDTTYIGYKTTTNSRLALTDIRMAYCHNAEFYTFGDATYGNYGTACSLTLYATKYACAGSPILADFYAKKTVGAPAGYEPICLFSAACPFDFNTVGSGERQRYDRWRSDAAYIYFMPSVTYTEGPDYFGGFVFFGYSYPWDRGNYKIGNCFNTQRDLMGLKECGYDMYKHGDKDVVCNMYYCTTKNPYRAVKMMYTYSIGDKDGYLPNNLTVGGCGYASAVTMTFFQEGSSTDGWDNYGWRRINPHNAYISLNVSESHGSGYDGSTERSTTIYVTAATSKGSPYTYEDIIKKGVGEEYTVGSIPEGYSAVSGIDDIYSNVAQDLSLGAGSGGEFALYLYLPIEAQQKPKYISGITATDSSGDTAIYNLLMSGCDTITHEQVGVQHELIFGAIYTNTKSQVIRDIRYLITDNTDKPEQDIKVNGIKYTLAFENYVRLDLVESWQDDIQTSPGGWQYVWVYISRNPKAGDPVSDIMSGRSKDVGYAPPRYTTGAVTQVNDERFREYQFGGYVDIYKRGRQFFFTRSISGTTYISNIDVFCAGYYDKNQWDVAVEMSSTAGYAYYLNYDFNRNTGVPHVVIAYNRTSEVQNAITGLVCVHHSWSDTVWYNGVEYYIVDSKTDLNKHASDSDDIHLYYTKDPAAGMPITDLKAVDEVSKGEYGGWEVVQRTDGGASNMNAGADTVDCDGYNACYLSFYRTIEDLVVRDGVWSVASIFNDSPKAVAVIVMTLMMFFSGAAVMIIVRKRRKNVKT